MKMRSRRYLQLSGICIVISLLMACAHSRQAGPVMVGEGLRFQLQTPASFGQSLLLTQSAEISFEEDSFELVFYTEIRPAQLAIVAVLPSGARAFTITHDGDIITSEGYGGLVERIGADYFLADFQLAQWPLAQLREGLESPCFDSGECQLQESDDGLNRTLEKDGMPVLSIRYSGLPRHEGTTEIVHHQRGYSLQVTTLEVETL